MVSIKRENKMKHFIYAVFCFGLIFSFESLGKTEIQLKNTSKPRPHAPVTGHSGGPVGEVNPKNRKKQFGSEREPAVLNLNDELEAISALNAREALPNRPQETDEFVKRDSNQLASKEIFFNKFLLVDNQVLLFGDGMTGLLKCKPRGGSSLVITQGRQINTKAFSAQPSDQTLSFSDDSLCASAMTVFKNDPQGESRLIVIEALADRVTRFDIR